MRSPKPSAARSNTVPAKRRLRNKDERIDQPQQAARKDHWDHAELPAKHRNKRRESKQDREPIEAGLRMKHMQGKPDREIQDDADHSRGDGRERHRDFPVVAQLFDMRSAQE